MRFSLIVIGAHNGSKLEKVIELCSTRGQVLLVEPVPSLFNELVARHKHTLNVSFLQAVITEENATETSFYAPTPSANDIAVWGDQLGSLNPNHARQHNEKFVDKIIEIKVKALTFAALTDLYDIQSIDILHTDTEGYDAKILTRFPFNKIKPQEIFFEYKHSDGVFNIGKNLANLLLVLDKFSYKTQVIDAENCHAILRN